MQGFNINEVEEIHIKFKKENGRPPIIYRGNGLEKIRRLISQSPVYGCVVIEEDDGDGDDHGSEDEGVDGDKIVETPKKGKVSKPQVTTSNGYIQQNLQYAPSNGKCAMDLARDMQKQAENLSGIKF